MVFAHSWQPICCGAFFLPLLGFIVRFPRVSSPKPRVGVESALRSTWLRQHCLPCRTCHLGTCQCKCPLPAIPWHQVSYRGIMTHPIKDFAVEVCSALDRFDDVMVTNLCSPRPWVEPRGARPACAATGDSAPGYGIIGPFALYGAMCG